MPSRTPLIAGNWKMHKTAPEAVHSARRLIELVADVSGREIMIAPTFTALAQVGEVVAATPVALGAQNLFWEEEGAYTGEVSARMLTAAGCRYVIIGHSERRQYFGETNETVKKRISAALRGKLAPVFCVGESEKEREDGRTFTVLEKQVGEGLEGFSADSLAELVVAYEPVWAIGTGKTATTEQAQEAHQYIRSLLGKIFGNSLANSTRILYGGSVKPKNIGELMAQPDIDGALVGGASLEAETFSQIVHYP